MMSTICRLFGHAWTDARNEVIKSGEVCLRCGAIREGNRLSPTPSGGEG